MFDPSGLIVGLPGLVTSCADLYKLTVKVRHKNHDVNIVVCRVGVEQMKFACWLEDVGFVEGTKPMLKLPPAAQNVMINLLQGIQDILTLLGEVIEKFEVSVDSGSKARSLTLPDRFWRLRISEPSKSILPKPLRRTISSAVKSTTWAAGEQERVDKLLDNLKSLNEDLVFVSGRLSTTKASMLPSRMLPHIWDESNLQTLIEATTQHEPEIAHCAEFKKEVLAATKKDLLAAQKPGSVLGPSPLKLLAPRISKRCKAGSSRLIRADYSDKATGKVEPVLLDDKSYADGPQPQYEKFVEGRVREVAAILAKTPKPARMQVLDCIGYVQNRIDKSFSFVFRFPAGAAKDVEPISLQKLFPLGQNGWSERHKKGLKPQSPLHKPALSMRFAMAQSLSQSLALLLACGVLHKGITPTNIVFFQKEGTGNSKHVNHDLSRPFISGFSWARLHGSEYISDTVPSQDIASSIGLLHAHPAYSFTTEQRYLKVFDVYSLGLVLLQIGLWRGITDIADELFPSAKSAVNTVGFKLDETSENSERNEWLERKVTDWQAQLVEQQQLVAQSNGIAAAVNPRRAFQETLVQEIERLLLPEAGEIYTRVVARCLTGDLDNDGMPGSIIDQASDETEPEYILQDALVKGIVEELAKCNV